MPTIAEKVFTNWQKGNLSLELWVCANESFTADDGTPDGTHITASKPEEGTFYKKAALTPNTTDKTLTVGTVDLLPTTTSLDNPSATYTAFVMAISENTVSPLTPLSVFKRFRVPPGAETWGDIAAFNAGTLPAQVGHDVVIDGDLDVTGSGTFGGTVTAGGFAGDGSDLTNLDAAQIGDGSVGNDEFQRLNGVTSPVQTQLNAKADLVGGKVPLAQLPEDIGGSGGVETFNTRDGTVTLNQTDVVNALGYTPAAANTSAATSPPGGATHALQKKAPDGVSLLGSSIEDNGARVLATLPVRFGPSDTNYHSFEQQTNGQLWLRGPIPNPTDTPLITPVAAAGNVTAGQHRIRYVWKTSDGGRTLPSPASDLFTADGTNGQFDVKLYSGWGQNRSNPHTVEVEIYATKANDPSGVYYRVATVTNPRGEWPYGEFTYRLNTADGSFSATQAPASNTTRPVKLRIYPDGGMSVGTSLAHTTDNGGLSVNFGTDQPGTFLEFGLGGDAGTAAEGYATGATGAEIAGIHFIDRALTGVDPRVAFMRALRGAGSEGGEVADFPGALVWGVAKGNQTQPDPAMWLDALGQLTVGVTPQGGSMLTVKVRTHAGDAVHVQGLMLRDRVDNLILAVGDDGKIGKSGGINVASGNADPVDGDLWYESSEMRARINGATVALGAGGGGGGLTEEQIRDLVAAFIVAGSNVTVTHDDGADTLTIASTGGGGGGSLTNGESVLASNHAITTNDTWENTSLTISLASAGTYLINGPINFYGQPNTGGAGEMMARLYNTTDGAALADSHSQIRSFPTNGLEAGAAAFAKRVEVSGGTFPKTITLQVRRNSGGSGWTWSHILGNESGKTRLSWFKVA